MMWIKLICFIVVCSWRRLRPSEVQAIVVYLLLGMLRVHNLSSATKSTTPIDRLFRKLCQSQMRCDLLQVCYGHFYSFTRNVITFHVRRSQDEMYIGHSRLYVCLSPCRIPTLLHGPGCNLGNRWRCPLVVHYWVDLQSVHWFRCYDNLHM